MMPPLPREYLWLLGASGVIGLVLLVTAGLYDGPLAEPALVVLTAVAGVVAWRWMRHLRGDRRADVAPARAALVVVGLALSAFLVCQLADRRLLIDAVHPLTTLRVAQATSLALVLSYLPTTVLGI